MDNLKLPANPTLKREAMSAHDFPFKYSMQGGFSKLELASLMIAQGMCANGIFHAEEAVLRAKMVLEEANK